jgi:hypothetical protein
VVNLQIGNVVNEQRNTEWQSLVGPKKNNHHHNQPFNAKEKDKKEQAQTLPRYESQNVH